MAGEWQKTTVGEFAPFAYGKGLPERHRDPFGDVPVFGSNGIVGFHSKALTSGPTVIIGRKGTVGAVHFSPKGCWPIDTTFFVVDEDPELLRFKYYLLKSLGLDHMNADSAVPGLNREAAHARSVSVPPRPEQRAIAHILGALDDKIELNRRMSETLEAMARALFKSWFVDFDPVRAKAEGRDPGLPQPLADLFPDSFEDSELGEIPRGWEVKRLPELIEVNPPRALRKGEVAPYLDMANMPTRGHSPDSVIERFFGSGMRFVNGDTLVARITPCLENGKTAFVDFLAPGQIGWGSTEYIVLRSKPPLPTEFAYCLARSDGFRDFAIQSMTGSSGRQRVPAESLDHYLLPSCPEPIAHAFGRIVASMFARASKASAESRTLAALRDALLPKLISGEVRVKDAERFLEMASP
jgi:type I restriction enzyme S subunit